MREHADTLLIPLDGSSLSEAVLPIAAALARALGYNLQLFHAIPPMSSLVALDRAALLTPHLVERWAFEETAEVHARVAGTAARLSAAGHIVDTKIIAAPRIAEAIIAHAAADPHIAMIAMTTHGFGAFRYMTIGSVAEAIMHAAPVPLLLVRAQEPVADVTEQRAITTILVPLDGSAFSAQALHTAGAVARACNALIILLAVATSGDVAQTDDQARSLQDAPDEIAELRSMLDQTAAHLRTTGLAVETRLVVGDPAGEIVSQSAHQRADLLIMATHGRSGVKRLLLGSVARSVVQRIEQPVLLVRPRTADKGHDPVEARTKVELPA